MSSILHTLQALSGQPQQNTPAAPVQQPVMGKGAPLANAMQILHQKHVQAAAQAHGQAVQKRQAAIQSAQTQAQQSWQRNMKPRQEENRLWNDALKAGATERELLPVGAPGNPIKAHPNLQTVRFRGENSAPANRLAGSRDTWEEERA